MRYGSVCSGIEAATAAWHSLGWIPSFFSEIDAFPRAVLAHHYPEVPLHGDFTTIQRGEYADIDVLVGGTPCQSFSVAGLRKGLADPRGNLMLGFGALAQRLRPRWLVWENVPGVLSSNGGRDFGSFLGMLAELGYGFAYRVLDAQHFGVAQRRRRVFVVGHAGDWRRAAAVLFERHSLSGHPAPSRETGKGTAARAASGLDVSCTGTLTAGFGKLGAPEIDAYTAIPVECADITSALCAADGPKGVSDQYAHEGKLIAMSSGQANAEITHGLAPSLTCLHEAPIVAHSLRGEGFDASEDGTGRGTPLVLDVAPTMDARAGRSGANSFSTSGGLVPVHAFDARQSDVIQYGDKTGPLDTDGHSVAVAFHENQRAELSINDTAGSLKVGGGKPGQGYPAVMAGMQVRRLTPRECERLQGFPDDYTAIPYRGKPADQCPDGPRYKALGNSMAVPVMRWIGQRISAVEQISQSQPQAMVGS